MSEEQYKRKVQTSVTLFLYCGEEYLFLKRNSRKRVDPGRLNGVGGRTEPGENYLAAAIRETREETGYEVEEKDMNLCGIVRLEGGYNEDWIMCFFKVCVPTKQVPNCMETEDGTLLWIHKDEVLDSGHELVDDLNYCFKDIVAGERIFFMNAAVGRDQKIEQVTIGRL